MRVIIRILCCVFFLCNLGTLLFPLTTGADGSTSRQTQPTFPTKTDNLMLGFGEMINGFLFADRNTTCSFDNFYPVAGTVNLSLGKLFLSQDMYCDNSLSIANGGVIVGNFHSFELPEAVPNITIYSVNGVNSELVFINTRVIFNSDLTFNAPMHFQGTCFLAGRGNSLKMINNGKIVVRPASSLTIENVHFRNLGAGGLLCLTDDASVTLKNSTITLAQDYTFSRGSILFTQENSITGTNRFIYSTAVGSTIDTNSLLYMGYSTTFSYAPRRPNKNLIFMNDTTSVLYLDGSTLFSTRTGLQLSTGTLILDDTVTISSGAHFPAEGLSLKSNLTVNIRGNTNVQLFGLIRAD